MWKKVKVRKDFSVFELWNSRGYKQFIVYITKKERRQNTFSFTRWILLYYNTKIRSGVNIGDLGSHCVVCERLAYKYEMFLQTKISNSKKMS